jgi:tetratricopeptide (TPR) repeat protein
MEATVATEPAVQTPATEQKKSLIKRTPKWAIYTLLALIVAAVLGYGYTQHWFKFAGLGSTPKANDVIGAVAPNAPAAVDAAAAGDALTKARQAFATGDLQGAINGYQALVAQNPNDINALGELGNVYYMTGWMPQATQTYFDAANKAIDQNRPEVAEALLPVIVRGNPMLASQLQDRMFDAQMRADGMADDFDQPPQAQVQQPQAQQPQAQQPQQQAQQVPQPQG